MSAGRAMAFGVMQVKQHQVLGRCQNSEVPKLLNSEAPKLLNSEAPKLPLLSCFVFFSELSVCLDHTS